MCNRCETTSTTTTHPPSHEPKRNHSTRAINIHNQSCPHNARPYTARQSSVQPSISYVHHRNKQCKTNSHIETPPIHIHDSMIPFRVVPKHRQVIEYTIKYHRIPSNVIECHRIRKQSSNKHRISGAVGRRAIRLCLLLLTRYNGTSITTRRG